MCRGFRHGSFDPPVTVWRVSSLQPKIVERESRQGSILLYLVGYMVSPKHPKAVTHGIGGFRQPCRHHRHTMAGFVTKPGKCLYEKIFFGCIEFFFASVFPGLDVDHLGSVIRFPTISLGLLPVRGLSWIAEEVGIVRSEFLVNKTLTLSTKLRGFTLV